MQALLEHLVQAFHGLIPLFTQVKLCFSSICVCRFGILGGFLRVVHLILGIIHGVANFIHAVVGGLNDLLDLLNAAVDLVELALEFLQPCFQTISTLLIIGLQRFPALGTEIPALLLEVKPLPEQAVPLLSCVFQPIVHFLQLLFQLAQRLVKLFSVHEIIPFSPSRVSSARFC